MKAITMKDGYGITISFAQDTDLFLGIDPKTITPPGIDGGDGIDTTTLGNTTYRTKTPKSLVEITDGSFSAAYDPDYIDNALDIIDENGAITFTFPDGASMTVYGFLKSFKPGSMEEGAMPMADCEIVITNEDGDGAEIAPAFVEGS